MVQYNQSKIYKIQIEEEIYVGSFTKKYLSWRRTGHVADSKLEKNQNIPLYKLVNSLETGWSGIKLELLEEYPCDSRDQLAAKEGEWIRKISTLNKVVPGRTWRERRGEGGSYREEYLAYQRKYYGKNHEAHLAYKREYNKIREICPHCGTEQRKKYLKQHITNNHPTP